MFQKFLGAGSSDVLTSVFLAGAWNAAGAQYYLWEKWHLECQGCILKHKSLILLMMELRLRDME